MNAPIIIFDCSCNLCNRIAGFLKKRDKEQWLHFVALQSESGEKQGQRFNLKISHPEDRVGHQHSNDPNSVILVEGERIYLKSEAMFRAVRILSGGWSMISIFLILPVHLRDFFYDIFAKNRYRWFGSRSTCKLPDMKAKNRSAMQQPGAVGRRKH
jgi:predicted DCC family thiol-disulfide oxidoreductase YuxK